MKILFLTDNLDVSCGIGRYSYEVISRIASKGYECTVLVKRVCATNPKIKQIDFIKQQYSIKTFLLAVVRLRKILKNFEVVHCLDGYPYALITYFANIGLRKKLFITGIGTYTVMPLRGGLKGFLLKQAYKKAKKIFCISNYVKKRILHHIPVLNNLIIVYMGVDFRSAHVVPKSLSRKPTIISVGMLKNRKGQHLSIKALKILKDKFPGIRLILVGSQDNKKYFEYLKDLIKENNLEESVVFYQNIPDEELKKLYELSDIFLMPSISINDNFEGFGLVYLEANSFGLPAVGSFNSGAEDAISDGRTGYLAQPESPRDIANKIEKIISDRSLYQSMSNNCLDWINNFNWNKTVESYLECYRHENSDS